jgi:hypothetical protein
MAGYLDSYGAGEERREKVVKIGLLAVLLAAILAGVLFYVFHNFRQERQAKRFFQLLAAQQFKEAYALWGCTESHPCQEYPFTEFMKDWGPQSGRGAVRDWRITRSRSCGSGVILTVDGDHQQEKLWVQRRDLTIGFSPWPGCPPGR